MINTTKSQLLLYCFCLFSFSLLGQDISNSQLKDFNQRAKKQIAVFLANLIAGIFFLALPFVFLGDTAFAKAISNQLLLGTLFIKYTVDFALLAQTTSFFDRKKYLKWYPLIMICYPIITIYISIKALTSSYEWKGRRFKQ